MEVDKGLLAPCGLYCGVCAILIADRDDDLKFKERLTTVYGVGVDDIKCGDVSLMLPSSTARAARFANVPAGKGSRGITSAAISPASS